MHKGRLLKKLNAFMTQQTALRLFAAFATIFLILVIVLALIARAVQEIYSGEQRKNRENTISNISISLEKAIRNNCQAFVERLYAEGVERLFDALSHEPKAASEMLSDIADNYPKIPVNLSHAFNMIIILLFPILIIAATLIIFI